MKRLVLILVAAAALYFVARPYVRHLVVESPSASPTAAPTPELVPTNEPTLPAARVIPPPAYIPTLDVVRELAKSNTPATLRMTNDWSSVITIDFGGMTVGISPGATETRQFPPGKFNYTASSSGCGSPSAGEITLEAHQAYSVSFYCSSAGVFGNQVGSTPAVLTVINNSSQTITLSINSQDYQVPPGSTDIRLAPGSYTYSASAPGVLSSIPESLTLSAGQRATITFSIQ